jgi:hypothetical protein
LAHCSQILKEKEVPFIAALFWIHSVYLLQKADRPPFLLSEGNAMVKEKNLNFKVIEGTLLLVRTCSREIFGQ